MIIEENKLKSIRRIEKCLFPALFRGVMANSNARRNAEDIKLLEEFVAKQTDSAGQLLSLHRRLDKIMSAITDLFYKGRNPNAELFSTKHMCLIGMVLFQELQKEHDVGQHDPAICEALGKIFDVFNSAPEEWDYEAFMKSIYKRASKVLKLLNEHELFIYEEK